MSTEVPEPPPQPVIASRKPFPWIPLALVVVILAAAAYGYWRLIYYPSTPQYAVEQLIEAGRAKDYSRVFDLVKLSGPLKAFVRSPDDLKRYAEQYPGLIPIVREYDIRDTIVNGDRAVVASHVTSSRAGRTSQDEIYFELVRDEGVWRLDGEWLLRKAVSQGLGGALLGGSQE